MAAPGGQPAADAACHGPTVEDPDHVTTDRPVTPPIPEAENEGPNLPHALTRERLLANALDEMVGDAFGPQLLTAAQREASLADTLQARPDGPVWLFGYGSLIWNPTIHYVESRVARVEGWQRAFCLSTPIGRGTPEYPGLVLALDEGGACEGVAFRLDEAVLTEELSLIWRREMLTGAYIPRWLALLDAGGQTYGHGIAFTVNRAGPQYADLPEDVVVQRLASARGQLGSSAEYLFETHAGLRRLGIQDPFLDHLALRVAAAQGEG
jgi:cation transport protein ChaC